jgi:uncharacterized protein YbjT (DUF2867 family)
MSDSNAEPILVVGGSRGTGLLIAQLLQRRGFAVRVLARNPDQAAAQLGSAIEVVGGDMTRPDTLPLAVQGVKHVICTAGVRSARPARESDVRATDYQGVLNVVAAARAAGFRGRFMYMNSIGVATFSISAAFLNLLKSNTLVWRRRLEGEIRASGLDYTIIRAGFLVNATPGQRAVLVSQGALPLSPRYVIARADVAEAFAAAMEQPRASRATFEVVWGKGRRTEDWNTLLSNLKPDP